MISLVHVPPRPPYSTGQLMFNQPIGGEQLLPLQAQLPVAVVGRAADARVLGELPHQVVAQPVAQLLPEPLLGGRELEVHQLPLRICAGTATNSAVSCDWLSAASPWPSMFTAFCRSVWFSRTFVSCTACGGSPASRWANAVAAERSSSLGTAKLARSTRRTDGTPRSHR